MQALKETVEILCHTLQSTSVASRPSFCPDILCTYYMYSNKLTDFVTSLKSSHPHAIDIFPCALRFLSPCSKLESLLSSVHLRNRTGEHKHFLGSCILAIIR